jgi:riboflavin kinase / FMN adenylyltransferase
MRVIRDLRELGERLPASVVSVGNFDGVHLAHQALLAGVVEAARARKALAIAVTFEPHPLRLLFPARAPRLLTPLEAKVELMRGLGIDLVVVLEFTRELSHLSPYDFVRRILIERLAAVAVHVGPNFRFGYQNTGDVNLLRELARREGFELQVLPKLAVRGHAVSSSRIRELLAAGQVHLAGRLLGRPYSVAGGIVEGSGIGRRQTVPTLNLAPLEQQLPAIGVYVTRTRLEGQAHESVSNVGRKPTFGEHRVTVESFLLSFSGEVSAREMEVEFLHRLRDEIKFPDAAALRTQILRDVARAQRFFSLVRRVEERARGAVEMESPSEPVGRDQEGGGRRH